ncbi:MATE family efflux transporter [Paenibacillus hemerocallicola]|uniref:Probable multidrug resistance protein NorM n=1 Tax=Paenibacillus hemerocallicola TaxID=1172614 RepID=A0A5C4T086_9BACL|nr:MATE family efflux transporter [Paenibacillus hemerocallicola]TNJ61363.1 MATE family efflux transporter [Paenibacillus hemerocallicola]
MLVRLGTWMKSILHRYFSGESMDYRQMLALFLPILIDQAFIFGLSLINTAMISSSGVAAVSAVNMVDSLNIFMVNVFTAVATGGTVVVAQYKGSGNGGMVAGATAGSIASVTLLSFGIGLLMIGLHGPILRILFGSASPDVMELARIYLIGSSFSFIGLGVVQSVCGALRGMGKTRASMTLSLIMNLLYVALNVCFVTFLHMGVMGMTVALNIARFAGAACALYYLFKVDEVLQLRFRDLLRVPVTMLRKIMFIGLPFAAEQMFFNGGKLLTQIFIVSMGTYAIATNAIASSLASVIQIPASALSLTIVTVVGQCIGGGNLEDARKFIKSFLWLGSVFLTFTSLLVMPLYIPLVSIFAPPVEIVDDIFWVILLTAIAQIPLWPISFILPSALRAAGDSRFTSISSMLSMWLFRVIFGYLLGITLGFGIFGVWLAMCCEWGVRGAIFMWRFRGKNWYRHRII